MTFKMTSWWKTRYEMNLKPKISHIIQKKMFVNKLKIYNHISMMIKLVLPFQKKLNLTQKCVETLHVHTYVYMFIMILSNGSFT